MTTLYLDDRHAPAEIAAWLLLCAFARARWGRA